MDPLGALSCTMFAPFKTRLPAMAIWSELTTVERPKNRVLPLRVKVLVALRLNVSVPTLTGQAQGARKPPAATLTLPPIVPAPPRIAPLATDTRPVVVVEPLRKSAPLFTLIVPGLESVPVKISVPVPSLFKVTVPVLLELMFPVKVPLPLLRSEERRVGQERRSR